MGGRSFNITSGAFGGTLLQRTSGQPSWVCCMMQAVELMVNQPLVQSIPVEQPLPDKQRIIGVLEKKGIVGGINQSVFSSPWL